ncbi:unnamed protein product, partial [Timema podura]|nr:unnamed protein product [Timema podura]
MPVTRPTRALRSRTCSSASDSPHSLDSKPRSLGSPLRPPRQCVLFLRLPVTRPTRALRSRTCSSASDSPHSLDSKPRSLGSPLRPPRQVQASECEDGSIRLDRGTYQYMFQDIVSIKTMLLKLKRVLQEVSAASSDFTHTYYLTLSVASI